MPRLALLLLLCTHQLAGQPIPQDSTCVWAPGETRIDSGSVRRDLELPAVSVEDLVIRHPGFSLVYSEPHEQAHWVAYELTKEETIAIAARTDRFLTDPQVATGTANDSDYAGSGYDRGHLVPAADLGWSVEAMEASFYYSNMSPQLPAFNRGVWKRLEELVRTWAIQYEAVYVVTGPVLSDNLAVIGMNQVAVPSYFYKAILNYTGPDIQAIGFILPNVGSKAELQAFAVSIDSLEQLTGLDFFPALPDLEEANLESRLCLPCWTWKSVRISGGNAEEAPSVQCAGTTQGGQRCQRMTRSASGYCYQHD